MYKREHRDAGDYRRGRTAISLNHGDDFKAESLANTMYTRPPAAEVWQHTLAGELGSAKVNNLSGAILADAQRNPVPNCGLWDTIHITGAREGVNCIKRYRLRDGTHRTCELM